MEVIRSKENKIVKKIRSLSAKKNREEEGLFILEGPKVFQEVLASRHEIFCLCVREDLYEEAISAALEENWITELCRKLEKGEPTEYTVRVFDKEVFQSLAMTESPQGILCVLKMLKREEIEKRFAEIGREDFCFLALDEIQDPGNMGTIIRTAEAFGLDGILVGKGSVDIYNDKVLRSTMGSVLRMPILTAVDLPAELRKYREAGVGVIGAEPHAVKSYKADISFKRVVLVIGNEANGIHPDVRKELSLEVTIPMPGRAESLNAGIAAALMAYEFGVSKRGF